MKKIVRTISVLALSAILCISMAGCGNRVFLDTTYTFEYAYIQLPNGTCVEGAVDNWCDYEGDQLQVTINGVTYLTHASNVVLVAHKAG